MKITYVYDGTYPSPDADATQVINTVASLRRHGANVSLAYMDSGGPPLSQADLLATYGLTDKIHLVPLPRRGFGNRIAEKLSHPAQAFIHPAVRDADLLYTRNIPALLFAAVTNKPIIYDTYRPWPAQYAPLKHLFRQLFRRRKMIGAFFHSEHALRSFADAGIDEAKLCVAHNGYNTAFFSDPLSPPAAREALGLPKDSFTIGYTGNLGSQKGIQTMLDLAERLPHIHWLFVGGGAEPELEQRFERLPNVSVFSWQPPHALPRFLYACDCLMIPPTAATLAAGNTVMPMKLFSYFGSGRPILAPHSPDTAELLRHNRNAWLLTPDDVPAAARQIEALRTDQATLNSLQLSVATQAKDFSWDARGAKLLNKIEEWRYAA